MFPLRWLYPFLLILLCLALYLPGITTIPPLDRDESLFAQTTKRMFETGNFLHPHFQEAPWHEKPIGIHWLQATSVFLSGEVGQPRIWPYRIPSVLGAIAAVLLTYWLGQRLFDRRIGFLGAALLASSVLLIVEAHLATTDAALLACVVGAQGCLAVLYTAAAQGRVGGRPYALGFWLAQGIGILIKGPVVPLISGLTVGTLLAADRLAGVRRSGFWWRGLRASWGLPLMLAIVLPWAVTIGIITQGAFFRELLTDDILPRLVSGHESHGAPPGLYVLLLMFTFWPGSLAAAVGMTDSLGKRAQPSVRFCLAWLLPAWLLFELIPTKLPHYVLPTYPALSLLVAQAVRGYEPSWSRVSSPLVFWTGVVPACIVTTIAVAAMVGAPLMFGGGFSELSLVLALITVGFGAATMRLLWKQRLGRALAIAVVGMATVLFPFLHWVVPTLDDLWISRTVAQVIVRQGNAAEQTPPIAAVGYHEPSLVFLGGTHIALTDARRAATFLKQHHQGIVLVSDDRLAAFQEAAREIGVRPHEVWSTEGINYSKGRRLRLSLFVHPSRSVTSSRATR